MRRRIPACVPEALVVDDGSDLIERIQAGELLGDPNECSPLSLDGGRAWYERSGDLERKSFRPEFVVVDDGEQESPKA